MTAPAVSFGTLLESAGSRPGTGDWGDLAFTRNLELLLEHGGGTALDLAE